MGGAAGDIGGASGNIPGSGDQTDAGGGFSERQPVTEPDAFKKRPYLVIPVLSFTQNVEEKIKLGGRLQL